MKDWAAFILFAVGMVFITVSLRNPNPQEGWNAIAYPLLVGIGISLVYSSIERLTSNKGKCSE